MNVLKSMNDLMDQMQNEVDFAIDLMVECPQNKTIEDCENCWFNGSYDSMKAAAALSALAAAAERKGKNETKKLDPGSDEENEHVEKKHRPNHQSEPSSSSKPGSAPKPDSDSDSDEENAHVDKTHRPNHQPEPSSRDKSLGEYPYSSSDSNDECESDRLFRRNWKDEETEKHMKKKEDIRLQLINATAPNLAKP